MILESSKCAPSADPGFRHIISRIRYVLTTLVCEATSSAISSALSFRQHVHYILAKAP